MALGENYNVILPFTVTNTLVPSTLVVGGMTVNGALTAQQFVALGNGSAQAPAYAFSGAGTVTGMFVTATSLAFSSGSFIACAFTQRSFAGGATVPAIQFFTGPATFSYMTNGFTTVAGVQALQVWRSDGTTPGEMSAASFRCSVASSNAGIINTTGQLGYIFDIDGNPGILNLGIPGTYAATWDRATSQYYCRPGLANYATNTITPSIARSGAHLTNLISGVTTVFFSLPTSIAGLKYTFTNSNSAANTVVVSPQTAADTINVFGLTKAAGASVAANAPFSSLTLHCITSTQWLATEMQGTWT